jgi:hypothetical protein
VGGTWILSAAPKTTTAKLREQLDVPLSLLLEVGDEPFGSLLGFLHRISGHP